MSETCAACGHTRYSREELMEMVRDAYERTQRMGDQLWGLHDHGTEGTSDDEPGFEP